MEEAPRKIVKLADVEAPQAVVWDTWTTTTGAETFLSPDANISAEIGGLYELFFAPNAAEGDSKGTAGCTVLAAVPIRKLTFEVIAPPSLGLGDAKTPVTVRLIPLSDELTRVQVVHEGFVEGPGWDDAHFYYTELWMATLTRLRKRFDEGPVDWSTDGADFEWQ